MSGGVNVCGHHFFPVLSICIMERREGISFARPRGMTLQGQRGVVLRLCSRRLSYTLSKRSAFAMRPIPNLDFLQTLLGVFWLRRNDPTESPQTTDMVRRPNVPVYSTTAAAELIKGCAPRRRDCSISENRTTIDRDSCRCGRKHSLQYCPEVAFRQLAAAIRVMPGARIHRQTR